MRVLVKMVVMFGVATATAQAQVSSIKPGIAAVTCFGGDSSGTPLPGAYVAGLMDISNPAGMPWYALWEMPPRGGLQDFHSANWTSKTLGQVFGIALGEQGSSDLYVSSTAIYGGPSGPNFDNLYSKSSTGAYQFGAIWRLNPTGGLANGDFELVANLKNTGAGLGQIAYNAKNRLLYVSNFFDGGIYTVGAPGNLGLGYKYVHSSIFTFGAPSPTTISNIRPNTSTGTALAFGSAGLQIADYSTRIWAVGYNPIEHRLYYGVVHGDYQQSKKSGATFKPNEIRSVGLDAAGLINSASDKPEFFLPAYPGTNAIGGSTTIQFSWPASDIAFSTDGKYMAIAERGDLLGQLPQANAGNIQNGAHHARILTYFGSSSNWTTDDPISTTGALGTYNGHMGGPTMPLGGLNMNHTNSAGGVDFGNGYTPTPSGLPDKLNQNDRDSFLWSTTNSYQTPFYWKDSANINYIAGSATNLVYGAQGGLRSDLRLRQLPGGTFSLSSNPPRIHFADFDGNVKVIAKNQIGDIEIRRSPPPAPLTCACAKVESHSYLDNVLTARVCSDNLNFADITITQGNQIITPTSINPPLPIGGPGPYCVDIEAKIEDPSTKIVFNLVSAADEVTQISQCCKSPEITLSNPK